MRTAFVILILALMSGCTTTQSVMESWVGARESELLSSWGAPYSSINTQDGKRVLTWQNYWGQYNQNVCRQTFTVGSNGRIEHWSYSGCPL